MVRTIIVLLYICILSLSQCEDPWGWLNGQAVWAQTVAPICTRLGAPLLLPESYIGNDRSALSDHPACCGLSRHRRCGDEGLAHNRPSRFVTKTPACHYHRLH